MYRRFVLYQEEMGVYLGSFWGLGFWSLMNPVGQEHTACFTSHREAYQAAGEWGDSAEGLMAVRVETAEPGYTSIAECVAAGLPGWSPSGQPANQ